MKENMKIVIIGFVLSVFSHCAPDRDDCHTKIDIYNNSSTDIYFLKESDTILGSYSPALCESCYKIDKGESMFTTYTTQSDCWEYAFDNREYIFIYIFRAETIESYNWDSIVKNNMYLKRYDLTLDDLKEKNWKIYYE